MRLDPGHVARKVQEIVSSTSVDDIHTHLYDPAFGDLLLWGIDDLLIYHYLVAETFRWVSTPYDEFWSLPKKDQANLVWNELFLKRSPISEACRGVLTTLNKLGLDVKRRDLEAVRAWFAKWKVEDYTSHCMEVAKVRSICMTNSPFDDLERPVWQRGFSRDKRFKAALRIDPLLLDWEKAGRRLSEWGYNVSADFGGNTISEVRRFLHDWSRRMDAQFLMVSLAPDFQYPDNGPCATLIQKAIVPHCAESGLPFAVMPGVRRAVNPMLRLAGDGVGNCNMQALQNLFASNPGTKFLCTILPRENQHELAVLARKLPNLHIFGCWWVTNIPTLIDEITRMRLELLGLSFTPQHSDARVLDQIIYKWEHSRTIIVRILTEKYESLAATGWEPSTEEIQRDVEGLFGGAYQSFCNNALPA